MTVYITANSRCAWEGCGRRATHIAANTYSLRAEHRAPALYCDEHASCVTAEETFEYITNCPNCGCMFPIN